MPSLIKMIDNDAIGHDVRNVTMVDALPNVEKVEEANILCMDTSTEVCTVALIRGAEVLAYRENADGQSHARNLLPYIDEILTQVGMAPSDLQAVAVGMGPGSYTGLRIGASTAKGLCYSLEIPMIAVPTLQIVAAGAAASFDYGDALFCPLLDARRMEVFTALYDGSLREVSPAEAQIVDEGAFAALLSEHRVVFCGNGMPKCRQLLSGNPNALFSDAPLSARNMALLASRQFAACDFVDAAYFEPLYGKEYVAAKPHVKGLR